MVIVSVFLSLIFLILAIPHLHWALGGTWGLNAALPSSPDSDKKLFTPGPAACLLVGLVLLIFSAIYFINPEPGNDKNWIFDWSRRVIPCLFLLRGIGDFKYVGLTKKVKSTLFARMDSKYYTPLCLLIAGMGFAVILV